MPRVRRTITVELRYDTPDEDYARLANAIWSLASMSDHVHAVQQDSKADPDYLNHWYDDDGRRARWS
ncbi:MULTISPECIES: hypothetical protein [Micromonospora]|uniref:hypothetical protein n=1 Tax=Micromonospora TaxID=1873 RepID=UPI0011B48C1C|nr:MULTISPECIES: hypothetical protein [unclassified Micromonospora]MBM0225211.1 hypothetical protein [Micromonospora sp. ATA51]